MHNLFEVKKFDYSFRSRVLLCQPKKQTTTHGLRSIAYVGAKLWNDLSLKFDEDTSLPQFRAYINDLHIPIDPEFKYV